MPLKLVAPRARVRQTGLAKAAVGLIALTWLHVGAAPVAQIPAAFEVVARTPDGFETVRYACRNISESESLCDTTTLQIGYYKWKKSERNPEPKRCSIATFVNKGEAYQRSASGAWVADEWGEICAVHITETISYDPGTGVSVARKTVAHGTSDVIDCDEAHGKVGSVKVYRRHFMLDVLPMQCTSVTMAP